MLRQLVAIEASTEKNKVAQFQQSEKIFSGCRIFHKGSLSTKINVTKISSSKIINFKGSIKFLI